MPVARDGIHVNAGDIYLLTLRFVVRRSVDVVRLVYRWMQDNFIGTVNVDAFQGMASLQTL